MEEVIDEEMGEAAPMIVIKSEEEAKPVKQEEEEDAPVDIGRIGSFFGVGDSKFSNSGRWTL